MVSVELFPTISVMIILLPFSPQEAWEGYLELPTLPGFPAASLHLKFNGWKIKVP